MSEQSTQITEEIIGGYLQSLVEKGYSSQSVEIYQLILQQLYEFLPEGKRLDQEALNRWRVQQETYGYADRTLYSRMCTLNGFLDYLQMPRQPIGRRPPRQGPSREELSRDEYLLLLQTAKLMGRRRAYLLIKTIVNAGLRTQELHQLTVEALRQGKAWVTSHGVQRQAQIPTLLCEELLSYAAEAGITEGPIFITKDGTPMVHSGVWKEVKQVCRRTGISEEKGNPRNLYQLYVSTYRTFCAEPASQPMQQLEALLEKEEVVVAWNK